MKKYRKMSDKELKRAYANLTFQSMTYGRYSDEAEKALREINRRK